MTHPEFLKIIYGSGAGMCLMLALSYFSLQVRKINLKFLLAAITSLLIVHLTAYFTAGNRHSGSTTVNHLFIPAMFLFGPSMCFYFFSTVRKEFIWRRRYLAAFLPAVLSVAGLCIGELSGWIPSGLPPDRYFRGGAISFLEVLFLSAITYDAIFYAAVLARLNTVYHFKSLRNDFSARLFIILFQLLMADSVFVFIAMIRVDMDFIHYSVIGTVVLLVGYFLFTQKYPEFYLDISRVATNSYRKTKLAGVNLKHLHMNIVELLLVKRLYMNPDISLNELAAEAGISPHQLSEFLNRILGSSFSLFVNRFRVEKAKSFLKEMDADITNVAFRVGFNSRANFNHAFKTLTGFSPQEYRNQL